DAVLVRRVSRQELGWATPGRKLGHIFPEGHRRPRVIARARRELDAHAVGFGLVDARIGKLVRDLPDDAGETGAHLTATGDEDVRHGSDQASTDARRDLLRGALATVLAQRVGDLVAHDGRQLVVRDLEFFDDAGVHGDLAAGHAPSVDLG